MSTPIKCHNYKSSILASGVKSNPLICAHAGDQFLRLYTSDNGRPDYRHRISPTGIGEKQLEHVNVVQWNAKGLQQKFSDFRHLIYAYNVLLIVIWE